MKKIFLTIIIIAGITFQARSQVKFYGSGGPEIIAFSFAQIDDQVRSGSNIMRFAPVFNFQFNGNVDFGKHFGLYFGGAIRNVGFIYEYSESGDELTTTVKKKYRNYNFGIPVGFKVGLMNSWLLYGGYEIEFPFQYKEKTFINGAKQDSKVSVWFSGRVPAYYNSVSVGIQFPYGFGLKFKYYLSEFFNQNYRANDGSHPYMDLKSNVWYISLNFGIFRNTRAYYDQKFREKEKKNYY
ncbi:MAG: hypothetical protein GXO86_10500 [Chlorobi bacterium]|nr:hypothetical protein [Chlorobiota bacterium]